MARGGGWGSEPKEQHPSPRICSGWAWFCVPRGHHYAPAESTDCRPDDRVDIVDVASKVPDESESNAWWSMKLARDWFGIVRGKDWNALFEVLNLFVSLSLNSLDFRIQAWLKATVSCAYGLKLSTNLVNKKKWTTEVNYDSCFCKIL